MNEIVIYVKPSCGCEGFEINIKELIETFEGEPWWYGLYWWKWDENVPRPFKHKGFTIKGKMAEEVMRKWSTKDRSRK